MILIIFCPTYLRIISLPGLKESLAGHGVGMSDEKWFMNLMNVGNVGSASICTRSGRTHAFGETQKRRQDFVVCS